MFMPIIGAITGGLDFSQLLHSAVGQRDRGIALAEAKRQGAVLAWGNFVTIAINFIIIAWVLFLVVKGDEPLQRKRGREGRRRQPAPEMPADVKLLTEIRDHPRRRRTAAG